MGQNHMLDEIRQRWSGLTGTTSKEFLWNLAADVKVLLAEIDRLTAENEQQRLRLERLQHIVDTDSRWLAAMADTLLDEG